MLVKTVNEKYCILGFHCFEVNSTERKFCGGKMILFYFLSRGKFYSPYIFDYCLSVHSPHNF